MDAITRATEEYPDHDILIAGDFNLPQISWRKDEARVHCDFTRAEVRLREKAKTVSETCEFLGLDQYSKVADQHSNILELVVSDTEAQVEVAIDPVMEEDIAFHRAISIRVGGPTDESLQHNETRLIFRKADTKRIADQFVHTGWVNLLKNKKSETVSMFYDITKVAMDNYTLHKRDCSGMDPR